MFLGSSLPAYAATPILTGGANPSANAASNYSDNGGGWRIDVAAAPWVPGPSLAPQVIVLSLYTYEGNAHCSDDAYVEVSPDGTTWVPSSTVALTLSTVPQAVTFPFPISLQRSDLARVRLRRAGGSCGVGGAYFTADAGNVQAWNMLPPTGTDLADAGFVVMSDEPVAPALADLGQFKVDASGAEAAIPEGGMTSENALRIKATLASSRPVKLEIELRKTFESFTGTATASTDLAPSGQVQKDIAIILSSPSTEHGPYHWQARAVDDLGNASAWVEYGTPGNKDFQRAFKVGVILAAVNGVPPSTTGTFAAPCKLHTGATFEGHNAPYYSDLTECINDYSLANSYDLIAFDFSSFGSGSNWTAIGSATVSEADYAANEDLLVSDALATPVLNAAQFDAVMVVHSGTSWQKTENPQKIETEILLHEPRPQKIIVAEDDSVGAWSHELGHATGVFTAPSSTATPDLYKMGSIGKWDLMARGSNNGGITDIGSIPGDGSNPPFMSSYARKFMGWLDESKDIHARSDFGTHRITALEDSSYHDGVFRYNLIDNTLVATPRYYLAEVRNRNLHTWDSSLPLTPDLSVEHLVLYYVDTRNAPEFGYAHGGDGIPFNMFRTVTIPGNSPTSSGSNDGMLALGESYEDYNNLVRFTASGSAVIEGKHGMNLDIGEIGAGFFDSLLVGAVHVPLNTLTQRNDNATALHDFGLRDPETGKNVFVGSMPGATYKDAVKEKLLLLILAAFFAGVFGLSRSIVGRGKLQISDAALLRKVGGASHVLAVITALYALWELIWLEKPIWRTTMDLLAFGTAIFLFLVYGGSQLIMTRLAARRSVKRPLRIAGQVALTLGIITVAATIVSVFMLARSPFAAASDRKGEGLAYDAPGRTEPDLDLHVYCPDGRHVGMNYATGEYEVQIADAITNGDNQGAPEWIFFPPAGNEGCRHVVSAHDNAAFLAENPDVASQITDTSDSYDIYARYIDPASGIFTSATLANQAIQPGAEVVHAISGTNDVAIGAGVVDVTPPVTTATFSGTLGADGLTYVTPVTVTLSADDGADGTGSAGIRYSTDGGLTWLDYVAPFVLTADGAYDLRFGSTDHAGNVETTKSALVVVDTTPPDTLLDSAPSGSTGSTSATFAFHATESATFECRLDAGAWAPCTSPATFSGLAVGSHSFDVRATDQAGNVDLSPASASWTILATGTVRATFLRHTVQSGTNPGSTKAPIVGATVNAYTKASGSCASTIGSNPHDYQTVLLTCAPDVSASTDTSGLASLDVLPGDYLVLSKDPQTNVVAGVSSGTLAAAESTDKFLQVIVRANGTSVPGKTTTRTGSLLHIIEPEYVEWSQTQELYPFVFDAPSGDWGVTVTVTPPEGFTADYPSLSTDVNNDYKALQFTLTDVGSCWECGTGVELTIRHKGRTEHLRHDIPTPMTEAFAREKHLSEDEIGRRGVWVRKDAR